MATGWSCQKYELQDVIQVKIATKGITAIILVALFISIASAFAIAGAPPGVPTIPPATPVPHGGGGGSYNPPAIVYPKYVDVKNSNGQVIGNITQSSASDISFWVEQPVTVVDGQTITVRIEGKLNRLPSDAKLDIIGETPDSSALPVGLGLTNVLAQVNLTRFSSGWDVKDGSLKVTLKVPQALIGNADLSKSLVLRYDGVSYELLYPTSVPLDNGKLTFSVVSPHEPFGYNSFSKYMVVTGVNIPSPTPTAVPTEVPTAGPPEGPSLVTVLLAVMLAAVVAAAFILYFMMQKKQ